MKKLFSFSLVVVLIGCLFTTNPTAQTNANPNPNVTTSSISAIRDSLELVWNDEFGGEIGCGAEKQALVTTNGTDLQGNPTSDEVRASAKWAHERYRDGTPKTRNGQLQHYVIEDGRNSWTENGVLHIRGQREENGHVDPVTGKTYYWTADGLRSSYFDTKTGQANLQAFRFGMMEARIYTVNGKALLDENGDPVLDADGNIMQDPKYSQGLWNGFWTSGNPDMSEEQAFIRNKSEKSTWPYTGEVDICEAYTNPSGYSTYNSSTAKTNADKYGIIIKGNSIIIKTDSQGKILINDNSGNHLVQYDSSLGTYVVAEGQESKYSVTSDSITIVSKKHTIRQDENGLKYIRDDKNKTIVDTEGNCYGSSTLATGQLHYRTGERFDGTLIDGVAVNEKTAGLGGGYATSSGAAGTSMMGDTGYHTYGVFWTPTQLVYYYDDLIVGYHDITDPQFFQLRECPQYIFLTFPIGGSVPGDPNPALDFADYLVDYVRIYQADDGFNTDENYQGSYGFPQLNDLAQPISYYNQVTEAYSGIKLINLYNSCEVTGSAEKYISSSAPFRSSGKVYNTKGNAVIKTKEKIAEGKYDVYVTGVSRSNSKDFAFTLNGTSVGTKMYLSDYAKDDYGKEFGSVKSTYIGTADIVNGAHNLQIGVENITSLQGAASRGGFLLSVVLVKNESSVATVTIDSDTELETPVTTGGTTVTTPSGSVEDSNVYKWNLYKDKFTANDGYTMNKGSSESSFFNTKYASGGTYFWTSNNEVGNQVTLTSINSVAPGVYKANLYARASGTRAFADVYINGIKVASNLNTGNKGEGAITSKSDASVYNLCYALDENTVTVTKPSQIEVKFVITDTSLAKHLYYNSLELTKIADVKPNVDIKTLEQASIRLNDKSGIRFYTEVDQKQIQSYETLGYTVELGTLIAPEDLIKDELTFESEKFACCVYDARNQEGSIIYHTSDDFTGIVGSIVNIFDCNLSRNFVGRGYVKLTKNGETTIVYSSTVSTRSAKFVASKLCEVQGWENNYTEQQIALVKKWANI